MVNINTWMLKQQIKSKDKLEAAANKVVSKMSLKKQSEMYLKLIRSQGIPRMRDELIQGLPFDWAAKYKGQSPTVEDILAEYRAEPKFQEVLDKLQLRWSDMEQAARGFIYESKGAQSES